VVAFTVPENRRSRAVMARIGMHEAGEFGHPRVPADHALHRHLLYRIDRAHGPAPAAA
jgi:RimJ/RimL family protein N-acetyltransferase